MLFCANLKPKWRKGGILAKTEYASQERKVFLTKLVIPEGITKEGFKEDFIKAVLNHIQEQNLRVVPTSPQIAGFLRNNRQYKEMLPLVSAFDIDSGTLN